MERKKTPLIPQALQKLREEQSELEHRLSSLRSEVSSVQDRNVALERSLSAETRIKLDLFSALGEAKRENEIVEGKFLLCRTEVVRSFILEILHLGSRFVSV